MASLHSFASSESHPNDIHLWLIAAAAQGNEVRLQDIYSELPARESRADADALRLVL